MCELSPVCELRNYVMQMQRNRPKRQTHARSPSSPGAYITPSIAAQDRSEHTASCWAGSRRS
jgi:hypothetical protein